MATYVNQVQTLYVEFLGRPADVPGLSFWATQFESNAAAASVALKNALMQSSEFIATFELLTTLEKVDKVYVNLFGRHADEAGATFWANQLDGGTITLGNFIGIVASAAMETDFVTLTNKVVAAQAFTSALDRPSESSAYGHPMALEFAKAYLAGITDDASLAAALAALTDTIEQVTGVPRNNEPTGAVTISGTAVEGQVLSASNTLFDNDGLGIVTYQWLAGGVAINGATGSSFTVTAAQAGKPISAVASYTDQAGGRETVASNVIASGNDTLKGTTGADVLAGGTGNDTYIVNAVGDAVVENADEGTDLVNVALTSGSYTLSANVENAKLTSASAAVSLVGNALNNLLTGNAGANTLSGNDGNDTLDGGAGADKLNGGLGDDTYVVDNAADVVTEGQGEGTDTVLTALATITLANNVENLGYTGAAAFTGTGNALDNILNGGNKGNKLDGAAGNDLLIGGDGADSLIGGLGNDTFIGATGKDTIDGGDGSDTLQNLGKFEDYTISRPSAVDTVLTDKAGNVITVRNVEFFAFADDVSKTIGELQDNIASPGSDTLAGGDGNDSINGQAGADLMSGGKGDDIYVLDNAGDTIVELADEGNDVAQVAYATAGTYVLAANVEAAQVTAAATIAVNLTGNELNNVLTGNAAANTLIGNGGDDLLDGGAGADKLSGGDGSDTYVVDNAGDVVTELADQGLDTVRTTLASYALTAQVENLVATGGVAFTGTGNAQDNVLVGGNKGNKLDGGLGNDSLVGGDGADSLIGGAGNDSFAGVGAEDTIDGGDGVDVLQGLGASTDYNLNRSSATELQLTDHSGNVITVRGVESFVFSDGVKTLEQVQYNLASNGNDQLFGTDSTPDQSDLLDGGLGADTLSGGLGDDYYRVDNIGDVIIEASGENTGNDLVEVKLAVAGTYLLGVNVENALVTSAATIAVNLTGNASDNQLTGNAAVNILIGGAGNDRLDGGAGADKLIGGLGDDTYFVDNAGDVVTELANEGNDTLYTNQATITLAATLENLYYTGSAKFSGTGNLANNTIVGGNADDKIDGGAGNDWLAGGSGNDSMLGGAGNDAFADTLGKDTLDGGDGDDTVFGLGFFGDYTVSRPNATDTVLTSTAGNVTTVRNIETFKFADGEKTLDEIQRGIISAGNDKLFGDDDNNLLNGGLGADTMTGGLGNDTYVVDNLGDTVVEAVDAGADLVQVALTAAGTYTLGDNVEDGIVTAAATVAVNLTGNALDNKLTGNAASNTLSGGGGNDTLDGKAGADKLSGGLGDDVYYVDNAGDVVTEALDEGVDAVRTTLSSYILAANVERLDYIGQGKFSGTGNALNNVMYAGNAGDKLDGAGGNDSLIGGLGNDSLLGGVGDDSFVGFLGKDTVDGGDGADIVLGLGDFADYQVSRTATDTVLTDQAGNVLTVRGVEAFAFADATRSLAQVIDNIASPGNDSLHGGEGNDTLNGGAGIDTFDGGAGDDTYVISDKAAVIVEADEGGDDTVQVALTAAGTYQLADHLENAVVTAAASIAVNLTGNSLDNLLRGNAAANILIGGAGNDTLDGLAGADKLSGGLGDDDYVVDQAGDVVTELAGEGIDLVATTLASYSLSANVEILAYTGSGAFTGIGNAENNFIFAGNGGSKLDGAGGDDYLAGGDGNDNLLGGLGNDTMLAGPGKDTVDGGEGSDRLTGLAPFSLYTIVSANATDVVLKFIDGSITTVRNVEQFKFFDQTLSLAQLLAKIGGTGNDSVFGTDGNDRLDGGAGNDTLAGGAGDDYYVLSAPGDVVVEAADGGIDTVDLAFTAAGTYTIAANVETVIISAAAGVAVGVAGNDQANYILGSAGANSLIGGGGDDTLSGGAGNDTLAGGTGDDEYVVADAGDVVKENLGEGYDKVFTGLASYTLSANVEEVVYTGSGAFSGAGNELNNRLFAGNSSGAKLDGAAGNDLLVGGLGNDSLLGGAGNDSVQASAGKDTIDGGAGDSDVFYGMDAFESYTVTRPNATDTVLTSAGGTVYTVRNVEIFYFGESQMSLAQVQANIASAGNDSINGGGGDDTLDGGAGADTMAGGNGRDTYVVDNVGDRIVEKNNEGYDEVQVKLAAAGTYVLDDYVEKATVLSAASVAVNLTGNAQDNYLIGNGAANKLAGGGGDDLLDGLGGNDTLSGGAGDDAYYIGDSGDVVIEVAAEGRDSIFVSAASYIMGANIEYMEYIGDVAFKGTGNAQNNAIFGGDSGATLDGAAGDDFLAGGDGNDSLLGGTGNDSILGRSGSDTIDGGAGDDRVGLMYAREDYAIARTSATELVLTDHFGVTTTVRNVETLDFADTTLGTGDLPNVATSGNDMLTGSDGDDYLNGLAGNDTLAGGLGDDVYTLDTLNDVVVEQAGEGSDTVNVALTAAGTYQLPEQLENAKVTSALAVNLTGNALNNQLTGNAAANTLLGGDGNDSLNGGAGSDSMVGGAGDDTYVVDTAGDKVVEAADGGIDSVATSLASYTLGNQVEILIYTGSGNFTGNGNELGNVIVGGAGADVLSGNGGVDTLFGGAGSDKLSGGSGVDFFVFNSLVGADTVTDFVTGTDRLVLDAQALAVGNGDAMLDGVTESKVSGGFDVHAELVVFTGQRMASASAANAAAVIGSAAGNYLQGDTALFAVSTASATTLYRFVSSGADAQVSAGELTALATLTGAPSVALSDFVYGLG